MSSPAIHPGTRLSGKAVIAGIGHTAFGKLPGRSTISLNIEAGRDALADAGIGANPQANIEIGPLPPVQADPVLLRQVWINLISNAINSTRNEEEQEIDIILAAGETATLTVRDNGEGIEDLDALFEPFYTTKKPGEGVGLGLAISSGIVNDLGGRLTARNAEGGGAVFEMHLPILGREAEAAE